MLNNIKVEIIDKTIIVLKEIYGDNFSRKIPQIKELIKLLYAIGSNYIEITPEIYSELIPLPPNIKFIITSNRILEIQGSNDIYNIDKNVNDIKFNRVIGFDDIVFYDYKRIFNEVKALLSENIEMCIKNKYYSATAMSIEWIKQGGRKIVTTFAGIGEYAPLEEIIGGLVFLEKVKVKGDLKFFPKITKLFEEITENKLQTNMPLIGKEIFNVESGIHVNGISKNPSTYEPYNPSEVGRERNIIIGKHSGTKSLEIKLKELNINYKPENMENMLRDVRKYSTMKHRGLNDEEIKEIYEQCCFSG